MPSIEEISQFEHPGVLGDFKWPKELTQFARYNLLFGWNGSGKTTLSRLLRKLEYGELSEEFGNAKIKIDGITYSNFSDAQKVAPVRVFNIDFINENLEFTLGSDMSPIVVVGKDEIEIKDKLEELKRKLAAGQEELQHKNEAYEELNGQFNKHCQEKGSQIKNLLRSPEESIYNNYDRANYRKRAEELLQLEATSEWQVGQQEQERRLQQARETQKSKIELVNYEQPEFERIREAVSQILGASIIAETLAELEEDHELGNWMHEGLVLHQKRESDSCLYCNQSIPPDRQGQLERHFNDAYVNLMEGIATQVESLKLLKDQASKMTLPNSAQLYEHLMDNYDEAASSFRTMIESVQTWATSLVAQLEAKGRRPFETGQVAADHSSIDATAISDLNVVIQEHNKVTQKFSREVDLSRQILEKNTVFEAHSTFANYQDKLKSCNEIIAQLEATNFVIANDILEWERKISEHRTPAEELNGDLAKYLGHNAIQLEVLDHGYRIVRDGSPAEHLSEGERTAIALLYFLKSLEDERFDLDDGVVVLDDPVSSLDSNALYLAFSFIKERTRHASQLFIFTHNFTLFRLTKRWLTKLNTEWEWNGKQGKTPSSMYMLDWDYQGPLRTARLQSLDPLLADYESEYHFLFAQIHHASKNDDKIGLAEYYSLANVARRLLEMFLAFRKPGAVGDLANQLGSVELNEVQVGRVLRFVQGHSHGDFIGDSDHNMSALGEGKQVMGDIMALIYAEDRDHHRAMTRVIERKSEGE